MLSRVTQRWDVAPWDVALWDCTYKTSHINPASAGGEGQSALGPRFSVAGKCLTGPVGGLTPLRESGYCICFSFLTSLF
ncbi:hypothetical protein FKM82_031194 [Ascaphus truei]